VAAAEAIPAQGRRLWRPRSATDALSAIAIAAVTVFVAQFVVRRLSSDATQFVTIALNGLTLGALYFLVASGFTLIFGLMRVTNMAHGAFYLLGGYIGFEVSDRSGNWLLGVVAGTLAIAVLGVGVQQVLLRRIQGQDLREALITIGLAIVIADQCLAYWGGSPRDITVPGGLSGAQDLQVADVMYPTYRLFVLGLAIALGVGLWVLLRRTRLGMTIRAGVDDRRMVAALGVNVQVVFATVFALGAALVGFSGVAGGSYLSLAPGEDGRYLLFSLIVVIVGGLGSVPGAAIGAALVGLVDQFAAVYVPTYSVLLTFGLMVLVLAVRPQGLLGRPG
jgi:branched-chain amino acid transport system permease protein